MSNRVTKRLVTGPESESREAKAKCIPSLPFRVISQQFSCFRVATSFVSSNPTDQVGVSTPKKYSYDAVSSDEPHKPEKPSQLYSLAAMRLGFPVRFQG